MVTIATVCQSKVSLMLQLDGLCNGAKAISVQLKEKKFIPEWKTTLMSWTWTMYIENKPDRLKEYDLN